MEQITVNAGLLVALACLILTVAGSGVVVACVRKDTDAAVAGLIVSVIVTLPFFVSFCYLLCHIVSKVGASI